MLSEPYKQVKNTVFLNIDYIFRLKSIKNLQTLQSKLLVQLILYLDNFARFRFYIVNFINLMKIDFTRLSCNQELRVYDKLYDIFLTQIILQISKQIFELKAFLLQLVHTTFELFQNT